MAKRNSKDRTPEGKSDKGVTPPVIHLRGYDELAPNKVPAGYKTTREIGEEWGIHPRTAENRLKQAERDGLIRSIKIGNGRYWPHSRVVKGQEG